MWIYLGIILIYLLSVASMWRYFYLAHSPKGRWRTLKLNSADLFWILFPIVNSIACLISWLDHPIRKEHRKPKRHIVHYILTFGGYKQQKGGKS